MVHGSWLRVQSWELGVQSFWLCGAAVVLAGLDRPSYPPQCRPYGTHLIILVAGQARPIQSWIQGERT